MNQQTQKKEQISKGSAKTQPNQPEYKDKPMQNLQDEKKNAQSKNKSSKSNSAEEGCGCS